MSNATGSVLAQKESERKSLLTKAQVFKNCFVQPIRKIEETFQKQQQQQMKRSNHTATVADSNHSPSAHTLHKGSIAEEEEDELSPPPSSSSSIIITTTATTPTKPALSAITSSSPSKNVPAGTGADAAPSSRSSPASQPLTVAVNGPSFALGSTGSPLPPLAPSTENSLFTQSIIPLPGHSPTRSRSTPTNLEMVADKLFQSVATFVVKRRHSLMAIQTNNAATQQTTAMNGTSNLHSRPPLFTHKQKSLSQPHTPTLMSTHPHLHDALSHSLLHDPIHLALAVPQPGPRRVSLTQMAQAMLGGNSSTPNPIDVTSEGEMSESEVLSPVLSPESRAAVDELTKTKTATRATTD